MAKKLVIVESPAKSKTIGKFLGAQFQIKASMGHIRDLPKKELGVDIEKNFAPKYVSDRTKSKIIKDLREAAKKADEIYLASDHDREGEAIAWHLKEILKKEIAQKPVHRIIFNEITKSALKKAVENPMELNLNMVDSQQARRILDRIVGYSISPILWKVIARNLSAGRVQSVALKIICNREEEINKFVIQEYWDIDAQFFKDKLPPFKAVLTKYNDKKIEMATEKEIDKIYDELKKSEFVISDIKNTTRSIKPYAPYITSTLQQDASKFLGYPSKKTMFIAQSLYEGKEINKETVGLITYMRTDSLRISDEANNACRAYIEDKLGKENLNKSIRIFSNKKNAQDAHEAIRPSNVFLTPESLEKHLNKEELKVYSLIWQRFVATQMIDAKVNSKKMEITSGKSLFQAIGSSIAEKGFTAVYPHINIDLGENLADDYKKNNVLQCKKLNKKRHETKPPARYSEANLIKELEKEGIGRPSTYASIISTLLERVYIEVKEKRFFPTRLGILVNKFLSKNFEDFFNIKFTANMEKQLDDIEKGNIKWYNLLSKYYKTMKSEIDKIDVASSKADLQEKTDIDCELCKSKMVVKLGRNGEFLSCSNYPKCKNIKNFKREEDGKIVVVESVTEVLDEKCPKCGEALIVKTGRFGKFVACSQYPTCKHTQAITTGIKCPLCDGKIVEKNSKRGKFYSCTNYPNCKFISNYKPVKMECPECGNYYMEERTSAAKGDYKVCPKCKKEVY